MPRSCHAVVKLYQEPFRPPSLPSLQSIASYPLFFSTVLMMTFRLGVSVRLLALFISLFFYIIPNFRFLAIGENSPFPLLIIVLCFSPSVSRSFLLPGLFLFIFASLGILFHISSSDSNLYLAPLISSYIYLVPPFASLFLGSFIGKFLSKYSQKILFVFLWRIYFFVLFLFLFSFLINRIDSNFLSNILFTGRTSFLRESFFFTEPSVSSPLFSTFLLLGIISLSSAKFPLFSITNLFPFVFLCSLASFVMLSFPVTFFLQLVVSFVLYLLMSYCSIVFKFLTSKSRSNTISSFLFLTPLLIFSIYFFLSYSKSFIANLLGLIGIGKLQVVISKVFDQTSLSLLDGFLISGGFRFYYAFVSVFSALHRVVSLPGYWYGHFRLDILPTLEAQGLIPPIGDYISFLQLDRSDLYIKPIGWLYFIVYDLGIIGFCFLSFLALFSLFNFFYPRLTLVPFSKKLLLLSSCFQFSNLLVPNLPSLPFVFGPLLVFTAICSYYYYRNNSYSELLI